MKSAPDIARASATEPVWHALESGAAAGRLDVCIEAGLTAQEAGERLRKHGTNRLAQEPPRPAWALFVDQLKSLLVLVLVGAALLAGAIGDVKDAAVILAVVLLNAALGFYQEHRAEATLAALKKMLAQTARVRRDGGPQQVPAEELVPGDVMLLEAGNRVPADGRILVAHNAEIDESALTGESHAVAKGAEPLAATALPVAECTNLVFMNTVVTRGRLEALVTATGMATEMGRLSGLLAAAEEAPTPLQIQLDQLGKRLAAIAGSVVALIFAVDLLRQQPLIDAVLTSIALAVAAIPEGLPAVVTVTLAIGMHRMAKNRAIVKKLAAVETLGCTTVICSDKTGTLTLNQMTARAFHFHGRRYAVSGEGYAGRGEIEAPEGEPLPDLAPLLVGAALCNDSRIRDGQLIGDPTEGALLALAAKGGIEPQACASRLPRIAEIPFDSAHKFMATFHHDGERVRLYAKGAPDVLLTRCAALLGRQGEQAIDETVRQRLLAENEHLAGRAMRVLAVATREIPARDFEPDADLMAWMRELTFVGLVGMVDPPRPQAREAIALCRQAGIRVKMITGDHKATAAAVARDLGLEGEVLTGAELERMSDAALADCMEAAAVFARVAPEHKVRIVKALKACGHVVAMTGDGVNDAPALKNADIGIAMGITGTEVTKEAATMVLTDDNFATIVRAVEEGRTIYDNLVKFVRFQLSTNIGAILSVLGATLLGLPTPFNPVQILWVNIIMDGPPAMSLGVEPTRPGTMHEPPRRPQAVILSLRRLGRLAAYGATTMVGTLGLFLYALETRTTEYALTLAFTTFVLFQFFNVFNARAEAGSAFNGHFFRNGRLWLTVGGVLALQMLVVHWAPAQAVFGTVPLTAADWALAAAVASSVLLLDEARKLAGHLLRRLRGAPQRTDGTLENTPPYRR